MSITPSRRARTTARTATATTLASLVLTACSGASDAPSPTSSPTSGSSGGAAPISAERCAQNRDAGPITYVTGYGWQASVGILEEVAAADLGYYEDLCLDVSLQPGTGDTAGNARLVAAGRAQLSSLGNASEILTARANGSDVVGIATLGHVPIATLLTRPDITDLTQLDGTTLGEKGDLPAPIEAMLVDAGVDVASLQEVTVGFDPSVLPRGQVDSLTAYRSNEPDLLQAQGAEFTEWAPEDYGVSGSFGAMSANPAFVAEHPTAAQDFLRATLRAFEHCTEEAQECVDLAAERDSTGTYDVDHNLAVWATESALVASSTPQDQPVGFLDAAATEAEARDAVTAGQLESVPDLEQAFDGATLAAVHDGTTLVWPAP